MQAARHWVASQDVQTIELHVWEANTGARRFYESLGLRSVQRRMIWKLEAEV
jgi:ribosomal protein S18 acetylase RimI-like enzyme